MKEYNLEDFSGQTIIWYEENGNRTSFVADESNPYYQEYLASLDPNLPVVKETPETPVAE